MKNILLITVIALVILGAYLGRSYKPVWQFDHLEQNARSVVTAAELQAWATNLLARNPTNLVRSNLGAEFPKLLNLAPRLGRSVCVYEQDDRNYPVSCVHVSWSSGMLGAAGFEIGQRTSSVSNEWQMPGSPAFTFSAGDNSMFQCEPN